MKYAKRTWLSFCCLVLPFAAVFVLFYEIWIKADWDNESWNPFN